MFDPRDIIGEFDPVTRIVRMTARKRITFRTIEEGALLAKTIKEILRKHLSPGRGYMITDYTRIIIEPSLLNLYAPEMKDIIDTFLYPRGIARYGMEITRITAKLGHQAYIGGNPNLFNTRKEAFDYIHKLIEERKTSEEAQTKQETQKVKLNG